jgi:hypothetical protein
MLMREKDTLPWMRLPKIEFTSDQTRIRRGDSVSLRWDAGEASEVRFWKSTFLGSGPLDWWRIFQQGEKVKAKGEIKLTQDKATAYYLVAKTLTGTRGTSIVVSVVEEEKPKLPATTWCPPGGTLPRMKDISHVAWLVQPRKIAPELSSELGQLMGSMLKTFSGPGPSPPTINFTLNPQVIFEDESTVESWNVSNASCVTVGNATIDTEDLKADPTQESGAAPDAYGYGFAGGIPCDAAQSGSLTIPANGLLSVGGHYQGHYTWYCDAKNALGQEAVASDWLDVLSLPQFAGSYAAHTTEIRNAIKDVDKTLRGGAIYNDTALDNNVDPFKKGQMSRTGLWATLLVALQNLKVVTFNCIDLALGDPNPCGQWGDYSNEIKLYWQPGYNPYLQFIIVHELIHKCGFNHGLNQFGYKDNEIETWACRIACTCYPDCGICGCCECG